MVRWIKYILAKYLRGKLGRRIRKDCDKPLADKWNHLSALITTKGMVRWDWNKIREIPVVKCHRCLKVLRKGIKTKKEWCKDCK